MKLRKIIEEFKVEAITTDLVTLSGRDGHVYSLKLGDRIASVYQMDITGPDAAVTNVADQFRGLGFEQLQ